MKNWIKVSLLTMLSLLVVITALASLFQISFSIPSSDIEYAPGRPISKANAELKGNKPKNIILFIADGLGFGHLSLALQTLQLENQPPVWQKFEMKGWHDTRSAYGPLTDSEASATAMATGTQTHFGHIGIDQDQNVLKNIFEIASDLKMNTGIVTDSYIWDATPAAFVAHTRDENNARDILTQIASSELDLIFGELEDLGEGDIPEREESLEILNKRFMLLDTSLEIPMIENSAVPIAAVFDEDQVQDLSSTPNLVQLTEVSLTYFNSQDIPFVLLVESEEMDSASHENDTRRVLLGLEAIQQTLSLVLNFAETDRETLVVFTADHETGGLAAIADFDHYPKMQVRWSTKEHTAEVVPVFAFGPGANYFNGVHRNWEIGSILKNLITKEYSGDENDRHIEKE